MQYGLHLEQKRSVNRSRRLHDSLEDDGTRDYALQRQSAHQEWTLQDDAVPPMAADAVSIFALVA